MKRIADFLLDVLGRLPTTNARIATSLVLALATWTSPPWEWLLFLGAMMGLDLAQFAAKRLTQKNGGTT